jgi:leucyl-tRNA synthetase
VSYGLKDNYDTTKMHVDINIVTNDVLDQEAFRAWRPEFNDAEFVLEDGKYICGTAVEKMSKSMFNVVNPDDIVDRYGADTLRIYEMFLGPLEQSKPWDTNGIDGVNRFLRKLWKLYEGGVSEEKASAASLKSVHTLIKKVSADIENFSFYTSVAAFMICVNDLTAQKCNAREVLEPLVVVLAPFAPHVAEELWHNVLGKNTTVCDAVWPVCEEAYLVEQEVTYPVSFNGKARFNLTVAANLGKDEVLAAAMSHPNAAKWLEGMTVVKTIFVPGKIVNIVVK